MNKETFKYFIKTIILLLITSYVLDKVVYLSIGQFDKQVFSGPNVGKVNHYLSIKDTSNLFVFGSSRANHHINTSNGYGFNMGMDGRKIAFHMTLIKQLPKNLKQTVLLHLDPEEFFNENYVGSDITRLKNLFYRNKTVNNEIRKLKQNDPLANFYYSILYNGAVIGILRHYFYPKYNFKKYYGYDPIYPSDFQKLIFKKQLDNYELKKNCSQNLKINNIYDNYLNEIIIFCKKNNKKLIVFTSPKYYDYCNDDNILFKNIMKEKNTTYYDYTNFFDNNNNNIKYWKDLTHLSHQGADVFTKEIKEIKELIFKP